MIAHTAQTVIVYLAEVRKIIGRTPVIRLFGIWIRRTETTHSCIIVEYRASEALEKRICLVDALVGQKIALHRIPEILALG